MSIYNRKHWHALSHSLHFVRHPPSQASKSGSGLPSIFNSVCLGLVQGQIDSPYLTMMSWITIPKDEYYTSQRKRTTYRDASTGFPSKSSLRNERRNSILMTFTKRIWAVLLIGCAAWESDLNQSEALSRPEYWQVVSMELLCSFLRRHNFEGKAK